MQHFDVVIAGGSFGGLTLSRLLQKYGINCLVLDARPSLLHRIDRGVGLWNHAQTILKHPALGMSQAFESTAFQTRPAAYRNRSGHWLSLSSNSELNRHRVATLTENELLSMLASNNNQINFSSRINRISMGDQHVMVSCQDGRTFTANVLIGSDGVESAVARTLFPNLRQSNSEFASWGAVVPGYQYQAESTNVDVDPKQAFETLSAGRRFACVPLRDGVFWFASLPVSHAPTMDFSRKAVQDQLLKNLFPSSGGWHRQISDIISSTNPESLSFRPICNSRRLPAWFAPQDSAFHGRVCLLGDAAHPTPSNLAQGASIAIEDSFSLAAELIPILKNSNFSAQQTADAFVRFQKSRKSRVQHYQTISRFTALLASPSQSAVETVRDFPLKVTKPGSWLNSAVFDLSLNYSLGQGCWSPPELPTL